MKNIIEVEYNKLRFFYRLIVLLVSNYDSCLKYELEILRQTDIQPKTQHVQTVLQSYMK